MPTLAELEEKTFTPTSLAALEARQGLTPAEPLNPYAQTWLDEPDLVDRAGAMGRLSWDLNAQHGLPLDRADAYQTCLYDLLDRQGLQTPEAGKASAIKQALTDHLQRLEPGKPASLLEDAKQWIRERTGLFEPPIYGRTFREQKPLRTLAGAAAYYGADYLNGLGLSIPDIVANQTSGYESLSAIVAAATGFEPTPRDIKAGEQVEFFAGLETAGTVSKTLVSRIAARVALKQVLAAGVTFAGRELSDQVAQKIINGDPIDGNQIWQEGGVGVLFGIGEVAISAGAQKLVGWTPAKLADEYVRRIPQLKTVPRADLEKTAQAALDSYQVSGGWMTMDQWHGKWDGHLQKFSDELRTLGTAARPEIGGAGRPALPGAQSRAPRQTQRPSAAQGPLTTPSAAPVLPPAPKAQVTAEGLAWIGALRGKAARGEPLTAPERNFLASIGIDLTNPIEMEVPGEEVPAITTPPEEPAVAAPGETPAAVEPTAQAAPAAEAQPGAVTREPWQMTREEREAILHGSDLNARKPVLQALFPDIVNRESPDPEGGDFSVSLWGEVNEPQRYGEGRVPFPWVAEAERSMIQRAVEEGKPVPRRVLEEYKSEPWADEALAKLEAQPGAVGQTSEQIQARLDAIEDDWISRYGEKAAFDAEAQINGTSPIPATEQREYDRLRRLRDLADKPQRDRARSIVFGTFAENEVPDEIATDAAKRFFGIDREDWPGSEGISSYFMATHGQRVFDDPAGTAKALAQYLLQHEEAAKGRDADGLLGPQSALTEQGKKALLQGYADKAKRIVETIVSRTRALRVESQPSPSGSEAQTQTEKQPPATARAGTVAKATAEKATIRPSEPPSPQTTPESGQAGEPPAGIATATGEAVVAEQSPEAKRAAEISRQRGLVDVSYVRRGLQRIMGFVEPTLPVISKYGRGLNAEVLKAIHSAEAETLSFDDHQLEAIDQTVTELEKMIRQYPREIQEAIMLTRGHGLEGEALALQKQAFAKLPAELKDSKLRRAIDEIADFNDAYLRAVLDEDAGDVGWVPDYFYGIYKGGRKLSAFVKHWQTTVRYTKHKVFRTYAEAKAFGLEARTVNPVDNLRKEFQAIARHVAMKRLRNHLMEQGEGLYIAKADQAPGDWDFIGDPMRPEPAFADVRVEPTLARLINSLISTNKITQNKVLDTFRKINNGLRSLKFIGSAFHAIQITKQSVADTGYLGFYKRTSATGFKNLFTDMRNDPALREIYQDYVLHGGGHRYSLDSQAQQALKELLYQLDKGSQVALKALTTPAKIPVGFVNWMFEQYIPGVKFAKYMDAVGEQEAKLGRQLTSAEKIEIVKEQQNFYGMMNERLFGRSGTVTTALRFVFMAPGYAEGNYRTIAKAGLQWGVGPEGYRASRSRANIINSWIVTTVCATVGTLIMTHKWPKKPESLEEVRDLLKIDTGRDDEHGDRIMIDLASYDKDYWNVIFNTMTGRPDKAVSESIKRIGGMKATTFEMLHDVMSLMMGKALYDWKGDVVYHPTDPFMEKMTETVLYEIRRLEPISVSVFRQSEGKDVDTAVAVMEALIGLRPTYGEATLAQRQALRDCWDLREKREELSWRLAGYQDPWSAVDYYNKQVVSLLNHKFVPEEMRQEWLDKLLIDPKKVVNWKRFPAHAMTDEQLRLALREHTYKSAYRRSDGKVYPAGHAKQGYEDQVASLRAELKKRGR